MPQGIFFILRHTCCILFFSGFFLIIQGMSKKKKKFRKQRVVKAQKSARPKQQTVQIQEKPVQPAAALPEKKPYISILHAAAMAGFFFFCEILLKVFTGNSSWFPWTFYAFCFSAAAGLLLYGITALVPHNGIRTGIRAVFMAAAAVLYLTVLFVYRQFKVFYDARTMLSGASDAFGQFMDLAVSLVFSPAGILAILLYFSLIAGYIVFSRKKPESPSFLYKQSLAALLGAVLFFIGGRTAVLNDPVSSAVYGNEYSFEKAVRTFGLSTGLRLDLTMQKNTEIVFEEEPLPEKLKGIRNRPVIYGNHRMEIDFDGRTGNETDESLDSYVMSLAASKENAYTGIFAGKNLIMITAEAFSDEVISPELTPTLYRLAYKGMQFTDYYQPASAGTTGGEYEILFGALPVNGGSSLKLTSQYTNYMTIASQLSRLEYEGWAFHNNWADFYDRHITHNNLGYSNGFMGYGTGMEEYVSFVWPESDLEMIEGTFPLYCDKEPFNVYYMTVSGHNGYDYGSNAMAEKNRERVENLTCSELLKGYYAANLELEDALTWLVNALEEKGIADDTVIVLSADHFPYGLDYGAPLGATPYLDELYGFHVTNLLERDHNRLIIWSECLEDEEPVTIDTPVSSLDILPTLSNLFGTEWDSRLFVGRDVFSDAVPLVFNMDYDWKTDKGTYIASEGVFYPSGEDVSEAYIEQIRTMVRNKMNYCIGYNNTDYFGHLFGYGQH